jgi:antitoxin component of MazEF toxin-antitoxin module
MPTFVVRRSGKRFVLAIPPKVAAHLGLKEGDLVEANLEKGPNALALFGQLKGRIGADEFTRLSNEGEDID